jgi:predicted DCC family thiol-disulfide oxidoreductase YuxK
VSAAPPDPGRPSGAAWAGPEITVLHDGACPLCAREVALLRRLDRGRGRIGFEDIATQGFDPARHGRRLDELMARIHGVLPDGRLVEGVEVFRRAYAAVGCGWLLAWTRWPGLRRVAEAGYRAFARNRLRLTGRDAPCSDGRCALPGRLAASRPAARASHGDAPPTSC